MVVQLLRVHALAAGGPGLDPWGQGTRSHMLQRKSLCARLRPSALRTWKGFYFLQHKSAVDSQFYSVSL